MYKFKDSSFLGRLKYWGCHAIFCGGPSFFFAFVSGWSSLPSVIGMILGIITFLLIYTVATTSNLFLKYFPPDSENSSLLHKASLARSVISLVTFASLFAEIKYIYAVWVLVEGYGGVLCINLTQLVFQYLGHPIATFMPRSHEALPPDYGVANGYSMIPTYMTTIFQGTVITLSHILLIMIFFLSRKTWKRLKNN